MGSIFWAISTAVFAILEVIIPGLVTIWLALAALIVTLLSGFINNSLIEFFIFAILGIAFVLWREWRRKNKLYAHNVFVEYLKEKKSKAKDSQKENE